jgi:hypothetical protein
MTHSTTKGSRLRLASLLLAGSLALTACTGQDDPAPEPTTYSTLGIQGEMLCGFVPKADLVTALGSSALTSRGSLQGRGGSRPLSTASCQVLADGGSSPNVEVVVWDRALDDGFTEWELKNPKPAWTLFPADHPIGFSEPAYRTGAVAVAIIGDWYINLRIYRPGKGRKAVPDSINLVQRVAASLQLPPQATRTYPLFTPRTSSTPSATPTK